MEGEAGLAIGAAEHEVGLLVPGGLAVRGGGWAGGDGAAVLEQGGRAAAAFALRLRQVVPPRIGLGAGDLGIEEPVAGFVREAGAAGLPGTASGDLLGRPALLEVSQDRGASRGITIQAPPAPPAGVSRLLSLARLVALGAGAIAGQFPGSG